MIRLNLLRRNFLFAILSMIAFLFVSYLFPRINSNADVDQDRRIHIGVGGENGSKYREGEVLVKFKRGVKRHVVDAIADSILSEVVTSYKALARQSGNEFAHLKSKFKTTQQLVLQLKKLSEVADVSPNFLVRIDSTTPDDENYDYLWGLHNTGQFDVTTDIDIDAPEAWDITTGSSSVIVGVVDTGIDYHHPDLIPNLWTNPGEVVDGLDNDGNGYVDDVYGINAITNSGDPMDDHSHGTHVAGTIGAAGNNNLGVVGVNWNVKLIGAKFLDASGWGEDADAIECLNYLLELKTTYGQNIVALNASFGGGDYDPVMESAINALGAAGIIFCAAAGNDWTNNDVFPHYPSSYACSNIIAVTAVDYNGWQYFNYGVTSVDIAAPGVQILSTIPGLYYPGAGDLFFDDMESGAGQWATGGTNNSWGITTSQELFENPLFPVPSPTHFWSDSPGADYMPNTDSWLMNASDIDLSGYVGQNLFIGFGSAMLFEAAVDHAYLEVSGDSGSTWHSLMDFSEYPLFWYIPFNYIIPDFVKTENFRFRFHLVTDFSIEWAGWLIDDIGIGTVNFYAYGYKDGTSMATPHVTGAVALIASQYPSETVAERVNRILDSATPLPSLIDICATQGMLNVYDALMLNVEPEINVSKGGMNFLDGLTYDLGTVPINKLVGKVFKFNIENLGTAPLNLTGSPDKVYLTRPAAQHFQVVQQPTSPIPLNGSSVCKIRTVRETAPSVPPGWTMNISFDINIQSDDPDESLYTFTVKVKVVE